MSAGEYCNRDVIVVEKSESVREVARLMREQHIGDVVVVEHSPSGTIPLGILTDRDLVVELLAKEVDLESVSAGDIMSTELVAVSEETKLLDAIKHMREKGVRRLVVVQEGGFLSGILTVDDILELLSEQLADLSALVTNEISKEARQRE